MNLKYYNKLKSAEKYEKLLDLIVNFISLNKSKKGSQHIE